jgi:hypothetical protein
VSSPTLSQISALAYHPFPCHLVSNSFDIFASLSSSKFLPHRRPSPPSHLLANNSLLRRWLPSHPIASFAFDGPFSSTCIPLDGVPHISCGSSTLFGGYLKCRAPRLHLSRECYLGKRRCNNSVGPEFYLILLDSITVSDARYLPTSGQLGGRLRH